MAGLGTVQQARELPNVGAGMRRPYEGGRIKGIAGDTDPLLVDVLQHFGGNIDEAAAVATRYYINERDRLNKIEMNNQIQEAELAWDAWSARALNGDGTGVTTDVDAYLGEDYSGSKEDVVGLNHIHGMSAPNAAEVYRSGSSAVMNGILNNLSPAARNAVAPRLRERQIRTYAGLVANGYKEYKNAVEQAQISLHDKRVDLMCAETAQSIKMSGTAYDKQMAGIQARSEPNAILAEVNARYSSASANVQEMSEEDSKALRKKIDEEVRAELEDEKEKALNEKTLRDQAIGAMFATSIKELDNDAIALYCDKYGVEPSFFKRKFDTLSEDERTLRLHIEHEISANKEKNSFALLKNLVANGDKHGVEFVGDVLEQADEFGRIEDWGIHNPILVDELRKTYSTAATSLANAKIAKRQSVDYDVSQILARAVDGGYGAEGWKLSEEEVNALRVKAEELLAADDTKGASEIQDAITTRILAERKASELKLQRAEALEEKRKAREKEQKEIEAAIDKQDTLNAVKWLSNRIRAAKSASANDENGIPLDFIELKDKDGSKTYITMLDVLEYTLEEKLSDVGYTEEEIHRYKKLYLDIHPKGDALYDSMAITIFEQGISEFGISSFKKTTKDGTIEDIEVANALADLTKKKADGGWLFSRIGSNIGADDVKNLVRIDSKSGKIVVDKEAAILQTRMLILDGQSTLSSDLIRDTIDVTSEYMKQLKMSNPTLTDDQIRAEGKKMMRSLFRQDSNSLAEDGIISKTAVTPFATRKKLAESKTTAGDVQILLEAIKAARPEQADIARGAWNPLLEEYRQQNSKKGNNK